MVGTLVPRAPHPHVLEASSMRQRTAMRQALLAASVGLVLAATTGCSSTPPSSGDALAKAKRLGPEEAIPYLATLLRSADGQTQDSAVSAICSWVADGQMDVIQAFLKSNDGQVRCSAVLALVRTGRDVAEGMPALTTALQDDDPRVRAFAAGVVSEGGITRGQSERI